MKNGLENGQIVKVRLFCSPSCPRSNRLRSRAKKQFFCKTKIKKIVYFNLKSKTKNGTMKMSTQKAKK